MSKIKKEVEKQIAIDYLKNAMNLDFSDQFKKSSILRELSKKYNVREDDISKIARRFKLPTIYTIKIMKHHFNDEDYKQCYFCDRIIKFKNAKYCPLCGGILSEIEELDYEKFLNRILEA